MGRGPGPGAHCGVPKLTEASSLGSDSPRTSPRNETVKQCRRQMTVANSPVHAVAVMNMMPNMMKPFITQFSSNFKSPLFCLHSSAHSSGVLISCHFANSEQQRCFWLLPIHRAFCIGRIEYGPDGRHRLTQNKVWIREYSPKTVNIVGFVEYTSANSMYKNDNKISQQQKVLHMNEMLERVTHFQTSLT